MALSHAGPALSCCRAQLPAPMPRVPTVSLPCAHIVVRALLAKGDRLRLSRVHTCLPPYPSCARAPMATSHAHPRPSPACVRFPVFTARVQPRPTCRFAHTSARIATLVLAVPVRPPVPVLSTRAHAVRPCPRRPPLHHAYACALAPSCAQASCAPAAPLMQI